MCVWDFCCSCCLKDETNRTEADETDATTSSSANTPLSHVSDNSAQLEFAQDYHFYQKVASPVVLKPPRTNRSKLAEKLANDPSRQISALSDDPSSLLQSRINECSQSYSDSIVETRNRNNSCPGKLGIAPFRSLDPSTPAIEYRPRFEELKLELERRQKEMFHGEISSTSDNSITNDGKKSSELSGSPASGGSKPSAGTASSTLPQTDHSTDGVSSRQLSSSKSPCSDGSRYNVNVELLQPKENPHMKNVFEFRDNDDEDYSKSRKVSNDNSGKNPSCDTELSGTEEIINKQNSTASSSLLNLAGKRELPFEYRDDINDIDIHFDRGRADGIMPIMVQSQTITENSFSMIENNISMIEDAMINNDTSLIKKNASTIKNKVSKIKNKVSVVDDTDHNANMDQADSKKREVEYTEFAWTKARNKDSSDRRGTSADENNYTHDGSRVEVASKSNNSEGMNAKDSREKKDSNTKVSDSSTTIRNNGIGLYDYRSDKENISTIKNITSVIDNANQIITVNQAGSKRQQVEYGEFARTKVVDKDSSDRRRTSTDENNNMHHGSRAEVTSKSNISDAMNVKDSREKRESNTKISESSTTIRHNEIGLYDYRSDKENTSAIKSKVSVVDHVDQINVDHAYGQKQEADYCEFAWTKSIEKDSSDRRGTSTDENNYTHHGSRVEVASKSNNSEGMNAKDSREKKDSNIKISDSSTTIRNIGIGLYGYRSDKENASTVKNMTSVIIDANQIITVDQADGKKQEIEYGEFGRTKVVDKGSSNRRGTSADENNYTHHGSRVEVASKLNISDEMNVKDSREKRESNIKISDSSTIIRNNGIGLYDYRSDNEIDSAIKNKVSVVDDADQIINMDKADSKKREVEYSEFAWTKAIKKDSSDRRGASINENGYTHYGSRAEVASKSNIADTMNVKDSREKRESNTKISDSSTTTRNNGIALYDYRSDKENVAAVKNKVSVVDHVDQINVDHAYGQKQDVQNCEFAWTKAMNKDSSSRRLTSIDENNYTHHGSRVEVLNKSNNSEGMIVKDSREKTDSNIKINDSTTTKRRNGIGLYDYRPEKENASIVELLYNRKFSDQVVNASCREVERKSFKDSSIQTGEGITSVRHLNAHVDPKELLPSPNDIRELNRGLTLKINSRKKASELPSPILYKKPSKSERNNVSAGDVFEIRGESEESDCDVKIMKSRSRQHSKAGSATLDARVYRSQKKHKSRKKPKDVNKRNEDPGVLTDPENSPDLIGVDEEESDGAVFNFNIADIYNLDSLDQKDVSGRLSYKRQYHTS